MSIINNINLTTFNFVCSRGCASYVRLQTCKSEVFAQGKTKWRSKSFPELVEKQNETCTSVKLINFNNTPVKKDCATQTLLR